ncbi:peptidylprolyl isomerase [Paenibacillus cremeus]|uniref:Peptidylprolyl isomerase n=1 Tax=Paenibacillus cremeus TaxID=2163881 RepID=A0A559JZU9_9BACL|nr:peptidylprolyl isomerase [Paenibacillus cremeus]TVY05425.1 peptidylprolyl isomerase [Paenibacillus cremeus]
MNKKTSNKTWIAAFLVVFVAFGSYVMIYPPKGKAEEAAAKVNGVTIGKTEVLNQVMASGGKELLNQMIDNEVIRQEAKKAGITVTAADVDNELASTKKMFPTEDAFNQALTSSGMTVDALKQQLETQVTLRKLLEPQINVTDEDIKQYYDQNLESMKTPEQVKASHILVATKEEAESILKDLKNGADFATVAKEKSTDTATKDNGGDLSYFGKGEMDAAFEKAAFALPVGQLSDVIQTSFGYHIIKVTDHKQATTPTLDEKKDEIRETLVKQQVQTLSTDWLNKKKSEATIVNYLDKSTPATTATNGTSATTPATSPTSPATSATTPAPSPTSSATNATK